MTAVPLLVRTGVFGCALAALVVAYPVQLIAGRLSGLLALVALLPAVAPRGRAATMAVLLAVVGWLIDTTWYGQPVTLGRLLALATLLYLTHSLTALAAVLPADAVVPVEVVGRWLAGAGVVLLGSAVLMVLVLAMTPSAAGEGSALAAVAGFAAAVAVAGLLVWLQRRR